MIIDMMGSTEHSANNSSNPGATSSNTNTQNQNSHGSIIPLVWDLNMRKSPSTEAESMGHAEQDKIYTIQDSKDADGYTWYKIGTDKWIAAKEGSWTRLTGKDNVDPIGFVLDHITGYDDWLKQNVPKGSTDDNWYRWTYEKNSDGSYHVSLLAGDNKNKYEVYSCTVIEEGGVLKIKE